MEAIPRIEAAKPDEAIARLRAIFFDIERKARLSGNGRLLMLLDRIPGVVLGPANRVSETAIGAALEQAYDALERVRQELEQPAA